MANSTTTQNGKPRACQTCKRQLGGNESQSRIPICQICQHNNQAQARQVAGPGNTESIPSAYFQLLDDRIAELQSAAEQRNQSASTRAPTANTTSTNRSQRPDTSYAIADARSSQTQQPTKRISPKSLTMERFLNDPSEPDRTHKAILSRLIKSR